MADKIALAAGALGLANTAYDTVSKYAPNIKGIANNIFSSKKRKSAMHYIKNLASPKGLKKLLTHDIGYVAGKASKFISSGKGLKALHNISGDVQNVLDSAKPLMSDDTHKSISNAVKNVNDKATHFHDVAQQYNEQAKDLATQWQPEVIHL
jgi:hypothetical protein